jgi:hypothetical protein
MMKRTVLQEILLFAASAVVGLTVYDFIVKPAVTKMTTPPQQPLATSSLQR